MPVKVFPFLCCLLFLLYLYLFYWLFILFLCAYHKTLAVFIFVHTWNLTFHHKATTPTAVYLPPVIGEDIYSFFTLPPMVGEDSKLFFAPEFTFSCVIEEAINPFLTLSRHKLNQNSKKPPVFSPTVIKEEAMNYFLTTDSIFSNWWKNSINFVLEQFIMLL